MSSLAVYLGSSGALTGLLGLLGRIYKVFQALAERRETKERLSEALPTVSSLTKALQDLSETGMKARSIIEATPLSVSPSQANAIASLAAESCIRASEAFEALYDLTLECKRLTSFKGFLEHVKRLDQGVYDAILCLARSNQGDSVDLTEFPMLLALYGPKRKGQRKFNQGVAEIVIPVVTKARKITQRWPRKGLKRNTVAELRRGIERFSRAMKRIKVDKKTNTALLDRVPEWMGPIAVLMKEIGFGQ